MKYFGFVVLLLGVFMVKSGDAMMRNKVPIRGGGGGPGLAGRVGGGGKSAWAHLEGADPETVKAAILSERPELKVHVVPHDAMVTMDMREDRVRLFVKDGKVVRPPRIG